MQINENMIRNYADLLLVDCPLLNESIYIAKYNTILELY